MSIKINNKSVSGVQLANALIRSSPSALAMGIPTINDDASNMAQVASSLNSYSAVMNEIQNALINRVIFSIVKNANGMHFQDIFRKGSINVGYTIQEIYNDLIMDNISDYDPESTATEFFKNYPGNTQAAYHEVNFRKKIRLTVSREALASAFISPQALEDFIASQVRTLSETMAQYMFITFKQLIHDSIKNGYLVPVKITDVTDKDTAEELTIAEKSKAGYLSFTNTNNNLAGVFARDGYEDLYLITKPDVLAVQSVKSLAAAFNMNEAEFIASQVLIIDDFGEDTDDIKAILVSKDMFNIYSRLYEMTSFTDPSTLNIQYYLHEWDVLFVSPFGQGVVFTTATSTVTAVSVTPASPTVARGSTIMMNANITGTGYPFGQVKWTVESNTDPNTKIKNGLLYVGLSEGATFKVKATSTFNDTVNGTTTVTTS